MDNASPSEPKPDCLVADRAAKFRFPVNVLRSRPTLRAVPFRTGCWLMKNIAFGSPDCLGTIFTIGHSTRTATEFISLLEEFQIDLVVDVRSIPRSRTNPQFNIDVLPEALAVERTHRIPQVNLIRVIAWRPRVLPSTTSRLAPSRPCERVGQEMRSVIVLKASESNTRLT